MLQHDYNEIPFQKDLMEMRKR